MSLNVLILIFFDLLIVIYIAFLIQQAVAYKAKFGYLCEASGLGEIKNQHHRLYNWGYFMIGLLGISFTYNLEQVLLQESITTVAIPLVYLACLALCFIAIFPRDTFHKEHTLASTIMFFCTVSSLLLLIYPFTQSSIIPKPVIMLNVLIPFLLLYYLYLKIMNFKKFGTFDNDMERYVSIWEWIPFITTYLWFIILNTTLILRLVN